MVYYAFVAPPGASPLFDIRVFEKTVDACEGGRNSESFSESLILAQNERW